MTGWEKFPDDCASYALRGVWHRDPDSDDDPIPTIYATPARGEVELREDRLTAAEAREWARRLVEAADLADGRPIVGPGAAGGQPQPAAEATTPAQDDARAVACLSQHEVQDVADAITAAVRRADALTRDDFTLAPPGERLKHDLNVADAPLTEHAYMPGGQPQPAAEATAVPDAVRCVNSEHHLDYLGDDLEPGEHVLSDDGVWGTAITCPACPGGLVLDPDELQPGPPPPGVEPDPDIAAIRAAQDGDR